MNDKTEQLIRELADKFGTTAEHLWGVLVRQAFISGICDLVAIVAWIVVSVLAFRFVQKKTRTTPSTEYMQYQHAEWEDEGAFFSWSALCVWIGAGVLIVVSNFAMIAGSLFNPEYWALKQLIP